MGLSLAQNLSDLIVGLDHFPSPLELNYYAFFGVCLGHSTLLFEVYWHVAFQSHWP